MLITKSRITVNEGSHTVVVDGVTTGSTPFRYTDLDQTRTGQPNPNYKAQIAAGENASTPFSGRKGSVKVRSDTGYLQRWTPSVNDPNRRIITSSCEGIAYSQAAIPVYGIHDLETAMNQAKVRAYKAVREAQYQISGPTFLAEFREAVQMLRRPASGLKDYAMTYLNQINKRKSGSGRRRPSHRKAVADSWLEYSFGWSPFLSDIKAIAETVARFQYERRFASVSGFGESDELVIDSSTNPGEFASGGVFYLLRSVLKQTTKVKIRVGLTASLNAPFGSLDSLVQLSGFSMQNFVPAVWEVLPWSFMVDYFSNIGDVLEAETTDTSAVRRSQISIVTSDDLEASWSLDQQGAKALYGQNLISQTGSLGSFAGSNRHFERIVDGLTYPTLQFQCPGSGGQVANLAALFLAGRRAQSPG
jgi:hypothetical protein